MLESHLLEPLAEPVLETVVANGSTTVMVCGALLICVPVVSVAVTVSVDVGRPCPL